MPRPVEEHGAERAEASPIVASRSLAVRRRRAPRWRLALASLALALAWTGAAWAGPRLVVLDGTEAAQLHVALQVALQPWSFEIVDWPRGEEPLDASAVASRAQARYVLWYEPETAELVLLDAELAHTERRPLEALPTEEADSSAVALGVKTMLRLPPPPPAVRPAPSWLLAPSVRAGQRWALDGESVSEQRISIGLEVGVPRLRGVRVGLLGAIGTSTAIDRAGFKGTWREWNVMVSTSKAMDVRAWRLWAQAAAGVSRATLDGEQNRVTRTERATQAAGALFVGGGRRVGLFTVGAVLAAEARGASRYARDNNQPLWDEPGLWLSALAALELSL